MNEKFVCYMRLFTAERRTQESPFVNLSDSETQKEYLRGELRRTTHCRQISEYENFITTNQETKQQERLDGRWRFEVVEFFGGSEPVFVLCAIALDNQILDPERERGVLYFASCDVLWPFGYFSFQSPRLRFLWTKGNVDKNLLEISFFLRGTKSLTQESFSTIGRMDLAIDARGVAVLDDSWDVTDRAQRFMLIMSLVCAYQHTLAEATSALAGVAPSGGETAIEKVREWSVFLARFYFDEPVNPQTIELMPFFGHLRTRFKLADQFDEVTQQLQRVGRIAESDRATQQLAQIVQLSNSQASSNNQLVALAEEQRKSTDAQKSTEKRVQKINIKVGWIAFFRCSSHLFLC
jgi:hypothetical protein